MQRRGRTLAAACAVAGALSACHGEDVERDEHVSLEPGPNPFGEDHPLWAPQPHRDRLHSLALSEDGRKLYVSLRGTIDDPGHEVAVVDTESERVVDRIAVGSSPSGLELHPGGRFLVVANRFSNWASVIDTHTDEVVEDVSVPFYTVDVAFLPDGNRAYLTNRWKDSVLRWDLDVGRRFRVKRDNYSSTASDLPVGIGVGQNPRDIAVSPDGSRLYVAAPTDLALSVIDTSRDEEVRRVNLGSAPGDVVASGAWVFVTHTGTGTHHPPDEGYDTDGDGEPGDGTANVMFQDLQNEIAVLDDDGNVVHNYTSDSICCFDYRDVDPDEPHRGEGRPWPDAWPSSRATFLPPPDTWIVGCALPEQMAITAGRLLVSCAGSNEVQSFDIGDSGSLSPVELAGDLYSTGMNPGDVVVSADGTRAYVSEQLGEHVTVLDLESGPGVERRILVGDLTGGEFPATDAEIGEMVNSVTAPFTVDGDQTCNHCHREGGSLAKPVAMPLQDDPTWGTRMQMAYRGAFDTRPWFFESSMDERNFFPVINEFARKENFCCEQLDTLVWDRYPSLDACVASPNEPGCNHVLSCDSDPPPECAERPYGSPHLVRNEHFRSAALRLMGRERTFGDALYEEILEPDGTEVRRGVLLDFDGVTRAIGLFLVGAPRLLPNPNAAIDLPAARRGRALYESVGTGCNSCHPLPVTAVSTELNPFDLPLRFPAVITPRTDPTGAEVDRVNPRFLGTFPDTEQDAAGVRFGVPQLRGLWDRPRRFFHDGRARSLREALATPGHGALHSGEIGFNETRGMLDTHGGTSHLSADDLEDLIQFLLTL